MATFNCTVDTTPMANSVDTMSYHVNATTTAVATMQTAVIATEKKATDYICGNIDKGFFSLIRSQISAKLAKHFTEMNSYMLLLLEYSKSLSNIQDRMNSDVNRIKNNYYKIFHSLDKALENRITEINRSAINLAEIRESNIIKPLTMQLSNVALANKDTLVTASNIVNARLKNRTQKTIDSLGANAYENISFKKQLNDLLVDNNISAQTKVLIPIIYMKGDSQAIAGLKSENIYSPDFLSSNMKDEIQNHFLSNTNVFDNSSLTDSEKGQINEYFNKLIVENGCSDRVAKKISELYGIGGLK